MTELTDKMRTCAAYIRHNVLPGGGDVPRDWRNDAADLLLEAAALLDDAIAKPAEPEMLGTPMEILPPLDDRFPKHMTNQPAVEVGQRAGLPRDDTWSAWVAPGGPLPGIKASGTRSPRACPRCDSRAYKRVFRRERKMYLHCGGCGHEWLFSEAARA